MRRPPAWWRTRGRRTDYDDIVRMFYWLQPEVIMGGGTAELPSRDRPARQAQGRRELHRQVRGGRLRVRRYGDAQLAAADQARDNEAARPLQRQEHRRRARPQVPQEGHSRQVPRPAGPHRRDARRTAGSVARGQGLSADGRSRPHRQIQPFARLGAGRLRHDHVRQRRQVGQGLRGTSATIR